MEEGYAFAHCISQDVVMGAGIAVDFNSLFGGMKEHVINSQPQIGQAIMYTHGSGRIIFNLVTKKRAFHKPTYETLEASLLDMKRQVAEFGIIRIAMPRIGCGLDRLNWNLVRPIIERAFADLAVEVIVCNYKPPRRSWSRVAR